MAATKQATKRPRPSVIPPVSVDAADEPHPVVVAEPLPAGGYIPPPSTPIAPPAAAEPPERPPRAVPRRQIPAPAIEPWVKPWRITWAGRSWTDEDVRVRHLALVAVIQGKDDWSDMSPWRGPIRLCAWIQALLVVAGVDEATARASVSTAKVADLVAALSER